MKLKKLVENLKNYGPHLVKGKFGKSYYKTDPLKAKTNIKNISIYGWRPKSPRIEKKNIHFVLIIGADSELKHVYFMDPRDPSDPKYPEAAKVYVVSYKTFLSQITSSLNIRLKNKEDGTPIFLPERDLNDYALIGNPKLNYL